MKRFVSLVLMVSVLLAVFSIPVPVSAEALYIRKIVSVVYDDSGSMRGDKWAYANYAMQAFCGMLNSEDQLYITYMSRAKENGSNTTEQVDLSAGGIQNSVDTIRQYSCGGSTPYKSVEIAFDKLQSVNDSNPNTQYWLVVITDGAFDVTSSMTEKRAKEYLNESFAQYTKSVMPNGTNPQVTFLGIGDVVAPDENQGKGIFTYTAGSADDITNAMSDMADRISGRTRLGKDDIKQLDDTTIQVSSSIPLLNIAVFAQGTDAKITKAVYSNETNIPVSRAASLRYPNYSGLQGGAYLLGDAQNVIGSGTYNITFDSKVDLKNVVVLFEPALEARMTLTVNGKEITNNNDLNALAEGDKLTVSCKVYEMGTDNEIAPDLLPPGTKFEIRIAEDGKVVKQAEGSELLLSDYSLKNIETEVSAVITIEGFNPIDHTVKFTPTVYVPKVVYTIESEFAGGVKSIKYDNVAANKDLIVYFTIQADGVTLTDPNAVKALNPVIDVSPQGNGGTVTYLNDGRIAFTPNAASQMTGNGNFSVDVTCAIDDGTTAKATYTVLGSDYQVVPVGTEETVKKTGFFENQVSVSFYITKDGVKLGKEAVEKHISVALNDAHSDLLTDVTVAADGTITVRPYTDKEHKLTFWNWWTNWAYYFGLEGDDVVMTLNHAFGSASATINVIEESLSYQLLNVYAPLFIELAALAFLITWIILIVTKPRYSESAKLYVGDIRYAGDETGTHMVRNFTAVQLKKFNKIKKGNGRLKFKRTADVVSANGIKIRADHGGRVICEMRFPWYRGKLEPADTDFEQLNTPAEIADYIMRAHKLEVNEFATTETIEGEYDRSLVSAPPRRAKYIVVPGAINGVEVVDGRKVIKTGKIFVYING